MTLRRCRSAGVMAYGVLAAAVFGWPRSATAYQEAPMLAERVAVGTLPPVSQRLPDAPLVVQPVHRMGVYGGTWRRLAKARGDLGLNSRLGYETLLRWDRDGRTIIPNIAERVEGSTRPARSSSTCDAACGGRTASRSLPPTSAISTSTC